MDLEGKRVDIGEDMGKGTALEAAVAVEDIKEDTKRRTQASGKDGGWMVEAVTPRVGTEQGEAMEEAEAVGAEMHHNPLARGQQALATVSSLHQARQRQREQRVNGPIAPVRGKEVTFSAATRCEMSG
eukprot:GHVU01218621.1.p2 GENE.GHVU01218621.1~~GHVU01218621.1.p2  ORF type:complete len:128 (+),score=29.87 GHVU01218621.1:2-385(+)